MISNKKIFFTTWLFLCSTKPLFASNCHPPIHPELSQYIVGYGSLIDEQSKKRTDPSAKESIPIMLYGYKRSWSHHGTLPGPNATFLSVTPDSNASLNGVIYQLEKPHNIEKYDKREKVYCRKELSLENIHFFHHQTLPIKRQIWIYVSKKNQHHPATEEFPIVQSYVDTFMRGCIQIEERFKINNFAKLCITKTSLWPNFWINDRIYPRRPLVYEPYAAQIDAFLQKMLPEQFKKMKYN